MQRLQYGTLKQKARDRGIDPDQSYQDLHDTLGVMECDQCSAEFVDSQWATPTKEFCSDGCHCEYIKRNHR